MRQIPENETPDVLPELMVRYQAANESSHTIVVYLLIFSTPFNVMLALPEWQWPSER